MAAARPSTKASTRELTIKTGIVKRYSADVRSYSTEKKSIERALALASASGDTHAVGRQRGFLDETDGALADCSKKLKVALADLQTIMSNDTEEDREGDVWKTAVKFVNEAATWLGVKLESKEDTKREHKAAYKVAVFGSSTCSRGDAAWAFADKCGELLARAGFHLLNGGYSGIGEATSEGASRVAGATVEGIISPAAFPGRGAAGNRFLTVETKLPDIQTRLTKFSYDASAFVCLPGTLETLCDLVVAWNVQSAAPASFKAVRPIFCSRAPWQRLIQSCGEILGLSASDLEKIVFFDTNEELLELLQKSSSSSAASAAPAAPVAAAASAAAAPSAAS